MKNLERVLIATDLSTSADEALREGPRLAARAGAALAVVHVIPPLSLSRGPMLRHARRAVNDRLKRLGISDDVEIFIEEGEPSAQILKRAAQWVPDIIVVGHRERPALSFLSKSVATDLVRFAQCPVFVAKGTHGRGIVAATDLRTPSLPAVVAGAEEAKAQGAPLRVVHAIGFPEMEAGLILSSGPSGARRADFAARTIDLYNAVSRLGIHAECKLLDGPAARAIVRDAQATDPELLVISGGRPGGVFQRIFGGIAERVARNAPCSVLVIRNTPI